jgi:hypothetical protein
VSIPTVPIWKQTSTGQSRDFTCMSLCRTVSSCLVTRARKSANLIVTFACCSCPAGVNLVCVVGTTLSCSTVWTVRDIHTSVSVHYFLYSGRSEPRDGDSPDTVASYTSLGRGSCGPKKTILLPSPFLVLLFLVPPALFSFYWGSP